jgi:hypothetical protein
MPWICNPASKHSYAKHSYATPSYATPPNIAMPHHQTQLRHTTKHSYATPPDIDTPHPKHGYATPPNLATPYTTHLLEFFQYFDIVYTSRPMILFSCQRLFCIFLLFFAKKQFLLMAFLPLWFSFGLPLYFI